MNQINEEIKKSIDIGFPTTFGKIGATEADFISCYLRTGKILHVGRLLHESGIYVRTQSEFEDWVELYLNSVKDLDCVLEWCPERGDKFIIDKFWSGKRKFHSFEDLEPFTHLNNGWHYSLEDKKILVVSPLEKTIHGQVKNFSKIWKGAKIGEVEVVKTKFQPTLTGEEPTYFMEVYEDLKNKISKKDFDFAIVGAGAFSLPLLSHIKKSKKPAIHMGGATQVVFGICGSRWDADKNFRESSWYNCNEYWTRPLEEETPINYKTLENGNYW